MFDEIPVNCRYGYARVSSKSQESNSFLTSQKDELMQKVFQKKIFLWKLVQLQVQLKIAQSFIILLKTNGKKMICY